MSFVLNLIQFIMNIIEAICLNAHESFTLLTNNKPSEVSIYKQI